MSEVRLIDANAFKKKHERLLHCDFPYLSEETLEELIDSEPTVDAEPKWIPVNERLPEIDSYNRSEIVLVCCGSNVKRVDIGNYVKKTVRGKEVYRWEFANTRIMCGVLAWMPLPKVYEVTK